jgi:hypothetical protein
MGSVTISGTVFQVYGTSSGYADYMKAMFGDAAVAFAAASADKKNQSLVMATRLLDRQAWVGTPVGTPEVDVVLQWPRDGVSGVDNATVPDAVIKGAYELASQILVDSGLTSSVLSGSNVQRVKAGSVEVEFFSSTLGITGRLPTSVQDLVGQYLSSGTTTSGSEAFGSEEESQFDSDDGYTINNPHS